jgi:RNA methyltransferase, TrmH family
MPANVRDRLRRITSRQNALLKEIRQAFSRGERTESGLVAVEGLKTIDEAIRCGLKVHAVVFSDSGTARAEHLLPQIPAKAEAVVVDDGIFASLTAANTPQGVAALVELPQATLEEILSASEPLIVAVVGLQDPGNLGTIIRSAEAFGAAGLVLCEGTVSLFNPKVIRASAASAFRLKVTQTKFADLAASAHAHNIKLIGTSSHQGSPLPEAHLRGPAAVVIGNEGAGLPRSVLDSLDATVTIPHSTDVESLNAAMAASLILYEASRQRRTFL